MRALVIGLSLALAGCGSAGDGEENAATNAVIELPRGPMLGPVDLSRSLDAGGARPFWRMTIAPGRITFSETPGGEPADFYPVSPRVDRERAVYSTQTPEGGPVTVTLVRAPCGEAEQPLAAEVRIGPRTLQGCAGQSGEAEPEGAPANGTG